MMFGEISKEDIRKIHNEINQLANQRFLLTTLAITVFALVVAWLLRDIDHQLHILTSTSIAFQTLLVVLYFVNFHLLRKCRMLTAYLRVTKNSQFEIDWDGYRYRFRYFGYTTAQSLVYGFLAVTTGFIPLVLHSLSKSTFDLGATVLMVLPLVFSFILVFSMQMLHRRRTEDEAEENWKIVKANLEAEQTISDQQE